MTGQPNEDGYHPSNWPESGENTLQIRLRIVPSNDCLVRTLDDVSELRLYRSEQYFECDIVTCSSTRVDDHQRVVHGRQPLDSSCVCTGFSQHDVVPQVTNVDDDSFDVSLFVPSSSIARELFDDLDSMAEHVELRSFSRIDKEHLFGERYEIDRSVLTEKQRTALNLAMAHGYYESPQEVTLEPLADELDISVSAFAKRLRAAERNVFIQLVD